MSGEFYSGEPVDLVDPDGVPVARGLVGYDATPGTAGVSSAASTLIARTVGVVSVNGTVDTTTALTDFSSGNNARSAVSTDGSNVWVAGADGTTGGVRYISSLGGTTSVNLTGSLLKNVRDVNIFNGQVYIASNKTPQIISALGTGLPTSGTPPDVGSEIIVSSANVRSASCQQRQLQEVAAVQR